MRILTFWLIKHSKSKKAFTLTEMLVGSVVATIIMTAALTSIVGIMTTERQEGILTETQQDMERALKYISNDIRESVYIYDFSQNCSATQPFPLCNLPNFGTGYTPIIAFWKVVPLTDSVLSGITTTLDANTGLYSCNGVTNASNAIPEGLTSGDSNLTYQGECNALLYKRKMYSLVVYLQTTNSSTGWNGKSRILRYELPKYNPTTTPSTRNTGFIDPAYTGNFATWAYNSSNAVIQTALPTTSATNPAVLTDFVDSPTSTTASNFPSCDTTTSTPIPANTATSNYNTSYATSYSNSFFVCVTTVGTSVGQNQVVKIYLRGNAAGYPGLNDNLVTKDTVLPPLQTSVTIRGVVDKSFP